VKEQRKLVNPQSYGISTVVYNTAVSSHIIHANLCNNLETEVLGANSSAANTTQYIPVNNTLVLVKHLKAKRRRLYLKTQSVPRCKHFSSRL
jgi:hypothetical protein